MKRMWKNESIFLVIRRVKIQGARIIKESMSVVHKIWVMQINWTIITLYWFHRPNIHSFLYHKSRKHCFILLLKLLELFAMRRIFNIRSKWQFLLRQQLNSRQFLMHRSCCNFYCLKLISTITWHFRESKTEIFTSFKQNLSGKTLCSWQMSWKIDFSSDWVSLSCSALRLGHYLTFDFYLKFWS